MGGEFWMAGSVEQWVVSGRCWVVRCGGGGWLWGCG